MGGARGVASRDNRGTSKEVMVGVDRGRCQ